MLLANLLAVSTLWASAPVACNALDAGTMIWARETSPTYIERGPALGAILGQDHSVKAYAAVMATKLAFGAAVGVVVHKVGKHHPTAAKLFSAGECAMTTYGAATNIRAGLR